MQVQIRMMRALVRYLHRKAIAAELDVDTSLVSRWESGEKRLQFDQFVEILRVVRFSQPECVTEMLRVLCNEFDHEVISATKSDSTLGLTDALLRVVDQAGDVAAEALVARADGVIDELERESIREAIAGLERATAGLRQAAEAPLRAVK